MSNILQLIWTGYLIRPSRWLSGVGVFGGFWQAQPTTEIFWQWYFEMARHVLNTLQLVWTGNLICPSRWILGSSFYESGGHFPPLKHSGNGDLWLLGLSRTFIKWFCVVALNVHLDGFLTTFRWPPWPHPPLPPCQTHISLQCVEPR